MRSSKRFFKRKSGTLGTVRGNEPLTTATPTRAGIPGHDAWIRPRINASVPSLLSPAITSSMRHRSGRPRAFIALACFALSAALACFAISAAPAAAMVGGAAPADQAIARQVVLIVGGRSLCTGVAIAPDLVLT